VFAQKGNPVLKHIRCVPWEYADIIPDYQMGQTCCALFLRSTRTHARTTKTTHNLLRPFRAPNSLKYHMRNARYLHDRISLVKHHYKTRVILALCDAVCSHAPARRMCSVPYRSYPCTPCTPCTPCPVAQPDAEKPLTEVTKIAFDNNWCECRHRTVRVPCMTHDCLRPAGRWS
jgi:hypothetical protein